MIAYWNQVFLEKLEKTGSKEIKLINLWEEGFSTRFQDPQDIEEFDWEHGDETTIPSWEGVEIWDGWSLYRSVGRRMLVEIRIAAMEIPYRFFVAELDRSPFDEGEDELSRDPLLNKEVEQKAVAIPQSPNELRSVVATLRGVVEQPWEPVRWDYTWFPTVEVARTLSTGSLVTLNLGPQPGARGPKTPKEKEDLDFRRGVRTKFAIGFSRPMVIWLEAMDGSVYMAALITRETWSPAPRKKAEDEV